MKTWMSMALVSLMFAINCQAAVKKKIPKRVVCYFTNWSVENKRAFSPKMIQAKYCSHIAYAYATIKNNNLVPLPATDKPEDELYSQINGLKKSNQHLQTMIVVGGPNTGNEAFRTVAAKPELRTSFAISAFNFLMAHTFDGLLLDWRYPTEWDKQNYGRFVQELHDRFAELSKDGDNRKFVAAALGTNKTVDFDAYHVPMLAAFTEFLIINAYDFVGPWSNKTGSFSALYPTFQDPLSVNTVVKTVLSRGAFRNQLLLGIATYGRTFRVANKNYFEMGADVIGPGAPGMYSQEPGFITQYEVCKALKNLFSSLFDSETKTPFAFSHDQWMTFENEQSIRLKMAWLKEQRLGGAAIWSLDSDDYDGTGCGSGPYPLTRIIQGCVLGDSGCSPLPEDIRKNKLLLCYYTNWSQHRQFRKFFPEYIDPDLCTHLVYMNADLVGNKVVPSDWNDVVPKMYGDDLYTRFNNLKLKNKKLKTLLAIGGGRPMAQNFSKMASTQENRRQFIVSVTAYVKTHGFNGITLIWQYPNKTDRTNFANLVQELSKRFSDEPDDTTHLILTAEVSPIYATVLEAYDVPKLNKYLDYIILEAYDLHGPWDGKTGHSAGLNNVDSDPKNLSVTDTSMSWLEKGADKTKTIIGIPFYTRTFKLKDANKFGVGARTVGPGRSGNASKEIGVLAYYEAVEIVAGYEFTYQFDYEAQASYYYKNDEWFSQEDLKSLPFKVTWVAKEGFAGVTAWPIDFDDFDGASDFSIGKYPMLHAILRCLSFVCNPVEDAKVAMIVSDAHSLHAGSLTLIVSSVAITLILLDD